MNISDKEKQKYFKEWVCSSKAYSYVYIFGAGVCFFVIFICVLSLCIPVKGEKHTDFYNFLLILMFIPIALCCLHFFFKKRREVKYVRFTPEAIYVEEQKIDLAYLDQILFIKWFGRYKNACIVAEFKISFFPNAYLNEDIHFYMEFRRPFFIFSLRVGTYDYESRFIKVLEYLAKERREKLENVVANTLP